MTQPTLMAQLVELQEENARLRELLSNLICEGDFISDDGVKFCSEAVDFLKKYKPARKEQK